MKGCQRTDTMSYIIYQLGDDSHLYRDATEKVVSLVSQGVKYVKKCSLIIKYC